MNDLELKRERIEKIVKYAALPIVGFIVAPYIFLSIKGLIGLVIAGVISVVVVNMIPWFAAVVANWRLKALKHEAAKNPIETLENDYKRRHEALVAFRRSILNSKAEVASFGDKLQDFKGQYPADVAKFDEQYRKMVELLKLKGRKYEQAKANLQSYESEIDRARAIWNMAQAAAQMNKAAGVDTDEFFAKIQVETALGSVQKSLNLAFADLEMSLADEKADQQAKAGLPATGVPPAIESGSQTLELDIEVAEPRSNKR
jgi:hypothetical protein